jgi:predicted esterase
MPKYASGEWKDSFAWYFADFDAQQVRVHPRVAAKALAGLLERLGLKERPKILLGFSQGAYFLPHLAKELSNVRLFLTIGAGVQARFFEGNRVPIYGIHGSADDVIPLQTAQETFGEISSWNKGALTVIPGMTHTINELGRARLAQLLDESSCHLA